MTTEQLQARSRDTAMQAEKHTRNKRYPKVRATRPDGTKASIWAHIAVVENVLGRRLPKGAHIHHVDGNGWNNAHSNLVVCQDSAYHKLLHARAEVVKAGGNPNTEKLCHSCQKTKPFAAFNRKQRNVNLGLGSDCRECSMSRTRVWRKGTREGTQIECMWWSTRVDRIRRQVQTRADTGTNPALVLELQAVANVLDGLIMERTT